MNILKTILSYENIVIQCHDNPDADALASGFALKWYLKRNGKDADKAGNRIDNPEK